MKLEPGQKPPTDWNAECLRLMGKIVADHRAVAYLIKTGALTADQWADAKEHATEQEQ